MAKSMIAQIREEIENFVVGWNLSNNNQVRIVEYRNPGSGEYEFSIRTFPHNYYGCMIFYLKGENFIYFKVKQNELDIEDIDWLSKKYKYASYKQENCDIAVDKNVWYMDYLYVFVLNKPADVYEVLLKLNKHYIKSIV